MFQIQITEDLLPEILDVKNEIQFLCQQLNYQWQPLYNSFMTVI